MHVSAQAEVIILLKVAFDQFTDMFPSPPLLLRTLLYLVRLTASRTRFTMGGDGAKQTKNLASMTYSPMIGTTANLGKISIPAIDAKFITKEIIAVQYK